MKLETAILFVLFFVQITGKFHSVSNGTVDVLSRQRRYIVFPKGASLQLLLEVLVHVPTQLQVFVGPTLQVAWPLPSDEVKLASSRVSKSRNSRHEVGGTRLWTRKKMYQDFTAMIDLFGMTVGLAWQLPDDPQIFSESKKKHKIYKRNAFKKMEAFMWPGGAHGRQCVLRALCESGQRTPAKKDFLKEILHKIFSYDDEVEVEETQEDKLYRRAHRSTHQNCETLYPDCSFSLFSII